MTLDPKRQAELDALDHLSDDELWAVVEQRLPKPDVKEMHRLMAASKWPNFPEGDKRRLHALVHEVNCQMLLRSQALVLLKQHGHDIESYLNSLPFDPDDIGVT